MYLNKDFKVLYLNKFQYFNFSCTFNFLLNIKIIYYFLVHNSIRISIYHRKDSQLQNMVAFYTVILSLCNIHDCLRKAVYTVRRQQST